ncbi:glutathione-disulfide reductase [Marinihelvus fidelis]|uniref:Glutathione reductase n=1 Tax=Marinihelvus fidelis TaxID=2613842 RepID=A0A5N0TB52_9GAMM|nr:glutathione-disulfide reductase [Marinihelvus fidelis]KAA9130569.1 glutathione-disulfide reductase [Marinihelvus fidelis]
MSQYDYDLFVIGAGSGGVRAARIAAGHGARVGICEESRVGGTCVIRGCVPKKLLSYAAHFAEEFEDAAGFGWTVGETRFDWATLVANKDREIDRLEGIYQSLLSGSGVDLVEGRGTLVDPHTVAVGERRITAERILLAVGGWPWVPDFPGREHVITSNEAFHLESLPGRVIVVGGGYIACEFAGIFNGLGSETHQVYRGDAVLRGFDDDVRRVVGREMTAKGVRFHLEDNIQAIRPVDGALRATLDSGDEIDADCVMYATGRVPKSEGLGLRAAGVDVRADGSVPVDEYSKTNVDSVFAVGDITHRVNLTPVALHEGHAFADTQFGGMPRPVDHAFVPSAVFSQPQVGSVGWPEHEARNHYGDIDVYRSEFRPMKHTLSGRQEKALMKMIVARETRKVVGLHVVGPDAPEIVQGFAVAVKCGLTKEQFDATIGIHPTAAEELVTMRQAVSD